MGAWRRGLGKSLQALSVAAYYHEDWPLLIICPSSLRLNWEAEVLKWLPFIKRDNLFIVFNAKDGHALLTRADDKKVQGRLFGIVIISYDLATKLADDLKQYGFGAVICDESHAIKNSQSKRTQAILPIIKQAKRAILLSGTRQKRPDCKASVFDKHGLVDFSHPFLPFFSACHSCPQPPV